MNKKIKVGLTILIVSVIILQLFIGGNDVLQKANEDNPNISNKSSVLIFSLIGTVILGFLLVKILIKPNKK